MRKPRFTESQIVSILKQGEAGVPPAEFRAAGHCNEDRSELKISRA